VAIDFTLIDILEKKQQPCQKERHVKNGSTFAMSMGTIPPRANNYLFTFSLSVQNYEN